MPLTSKLGSSADKHVYAFVNVRLLHEGSVSSVYVGDCCCNALPTEAGPKAIKVYHKTAALQARHRLNISREVALLKHLKSLRVPGVVKLCGTAEDHSSVYLVFDQCAGGDLYARLAHRGLLSEQQLATEVLIPLLKVLTALHKLGIIHRDIKPENIFFDADGVLCLGDFGLAINTNTDRPISRVGTTEYMAPEVLAQPTANQVAFYGLKRSRLQPYTAAVDIWSVGVLISECLMGITPVGTSKREASDLSNHSFRGLNPPRPGMSSGCANFVAQVLAEQPEQRPTALQLLSHPWLVSYMAVEDVEAYASDAADWVPPAVSLLRNSRSSPLTTCSKDSEPCTDLISLYIRHERGVKSGCGYNHREFCGCSRVPHHLQPAAAPQQQNTQPKRLCVSDASGWQQELKQDHMRHLQRCQKQGIGCARSHIAAVWCSPATGATCLLPSPEAAHLQTNKDMTVQPASSDSRHDHNKPDMEFCMAPKETSSRALQNVAALHSSIKDLIPAAAVASRHGSSTQLLTSRRECLSRPCTCSASSVANDQTDVKAVKGVSSKQLTDNQNECADDASSCHQTRATQHSTRSSKSVWVLRPAPAGGARHVRGPGRSMWTRVQSLCCASTQDGNRPSK